MLPNFKRFHEIVTFRHFSKYNVAPIKNWLLAKRYKKLGTICVWTLNHGIDNYNRIFGIFIEIWSELEFYI